MVANQTKFKRICIFSSLDFKEIKHISNQLEEILKNLNLDILIPKSFSSYKTIFGRYYSDSYIVKNADLAPLCPKDFNVASPCTASKNSDANAA